MSHRRSLRFVCAAALIAFVGRAPPGLEKKCQLQALPDADPGVLPALDLKIAPSVGQAPEEGDWVDAAEVKGFQVRVQGLPGTWICVFFRAWIDTGPDPVLGDRILLDNPWLARLDPVESLGGVALPEGYPSPAISEEQWTELYDRVVTEAGGDIGVIRNYFQPILDGTAPATSARSRIWKTPAPLWPANGQTWLTWTKLLYDIDDGIPDDRTLSGLKVFFRACFNQAPSNAAVTSLIQSDQLTQAEALGMIKVDVQAVALRMPDPHPAYSVDEDNHGLVGLSGTGIPGSTPTLPVLGLSTTACLTVDIGSRTGAIHAPLVIANAQPGGSAIIPFDDFVWPVFAHYAFDSDPTTTYQVQGRFAGIGRARFLIPAGFPTGTGRIVAFSNAFVTSPADPAPWAVININP